MNNYEPKDIAGKLAKYFLNSPLTMVLGIFLLVIGYLSLVITPREEDPQIKVSGGSVIVALPGASANEIKNIIVEPLERKIREIKEVEHIYGMALDNVGIVNVMFYIGEDKEASNLKLYDKVMQNLDLLPKNAMQPLIKPLDIDTVIPILTVAFYAKEKGYDKTELTKKVYEIQQKLNALKDVAVTDMKGAFKEQYNAMVDIDRLKAYNLSLGQLLQAIESANYDIPNVDVSTNEGKIALFGSDDIIKDKKDVENIIVANYGGSLIYLKDVAKIEKGFDYQNDKRAFIYPNKESDALEQVTLTISKLKASNAVNVANDVLAFLDTQKEVLQKEGVEFTVTRDFGKRADEAVNELVFHLEISILIIAVLLVFALGLKESLIVTLTVPAILGVTLFIAYLTDQTINRITLFAFLLSLGLLVDAAIIVIENIHRHFHKGHHDEHLSTDDLLIEATDEIGAPTNIATLAIILTMVPMYFVGKMMGQFMKPIPSNVPVALFASLFVAYIFTPYLAKKLLGGKKHGGV